MVKALVKPLLLFAVVVLVLASSEATAQVLYPRQQPAATIDLAGPRVGMTFLSDGVREKLNGQIGPVVSQFGWQKEKRFLASPDGFTGVTEFVMLAGGVEQGVLLPSFTWLVGARTAKGVEFAVGPNLTPFGGALAAAAGVTFRAGNLNLPVNFAAVRSRDGLRVSVLAGFNARRP